MKGDGKFIDWSDKEIIHIANESPPIRIATLDEGIASGEPSVAIGIDIGGDKVVIAETSVNLFLLAADLIRKRYNL